MNIEEAKRRAARSARAVKEMAVQQRQSVQMYVTSWRGADSVALVAVKGDPDQLVTAAYLSATGFGADILAISVDTWMSESLTHPETGRPWQPGELRQYAAAHPGLASELFKEMLITSVFNRAGDSAHQVQAYEVVSSPLVVGGSEVKWLDWQPPGNAEMGGRIQEQLLAIMLMPPIDVVIAQRDPSYAEDPLWRHAADVATMETFNSRFGATVVVSLFAEPDTDRQRYFRRRLGMGQFIEPEIDDR